jgi:hypothetical protein
MPGPKYWAASTGATDSTGAWTATCHAPTAGHIIIFHLLQDGTGAASTITSTTNIEDLAGTDGAWTVVGTGAVGSATLANQRIWIGRSLSTSAPVITGANSSGDDGYWRFYEFSNVSTGTTLATVIENVTAGAIVTGAATDGTVADASVTTLDLERLAINLIGVSDDNAIAAFTGQTGGTWVNNAGYADSAGTDGSIELMTGLVGDIAVYAGGGNMNFGQVTGNERVAQSFTPSNGNVYAVGVQLHNSSAATDDVVVEIQTDSSGAPSETVVASATIDLAPWPTGASNTYLGEVIIGASLTPSTKYWLVLRRSGALDDATPIGVERTSASEYAGHAAKRYTSGAWQADETYDLGFTVHYTSVAGVIDGGTATNPDATDGWGVVGFALIGTYVAPAARVPRFTPYPQLLAH